jgi:hypothetical protein
MTEQNNTEAPTTDQTTPAQAEPAGAATEQRIPQQFLDQLSQARNAVKQYEEAEAQRKKEAQLREEQEATKRGEFETVLKSKEQVLAEKDAEIERLNRKALEGELERKLIKAGLKDDDAMLGKVSRYFAQEDAPDMDAWIDAEKKSKPQQFEASVEAIKPGAAGMAATGAPVNKIEELKEKLKSKDMYERSKAAQEYRALMESGELG